MSTYENQQNYLTKVMQECLSDEDQIDDPYKNDGSSGEYEQESTYDDSDNSVVPLSNKRKKYIHSQQVAQNIQNVENLPSTSRQSTKTNLPSTSRASTETNSAKSVEQTIENVIRDMQNFSSDEEQTETEKADTYIIWNPVTGCHLKKFDFTEANHGYRTQLYADFHNKGPYDFYKLFVNDDIINLIVIETNHYADQCTQKNVLRKARITSWKPTNAAEIEKLLGVFLWMGLCPMPQIQSYWSKKLMYKNYIKDVISRNRFQLLLQILYFSDNSVITEDRLQKIMPLVNMLRKSFQEPVIPSEYICIDETLVPFRGRLKFLQYIKNKKHKFGIKMFKLCLQKGYAYDFQIYCGKSKDKDMSVSSKIVMDLMGDLLDKGRTVCTDNYYTSVALAQALLQRKTYLIGTLRSNRKNNPKDVIQQKLKRGETVAAECEQGIVIQKWKDKRDLVTLSTKHTDAMVSVKKRNKPHVIEYNKYKSYIYLSDQIKSYNTSLQKSLKWYRKLALELLTGTAFVNAYTAYQEIANENMSITTFREVIVGLLKSVDIPREETVSDEVEHVFIQQTLCTMLCSDG